MPKGSKHIFDRLLPGDSIAHTEYNAIVEAVETLSAKSDSAGSAKALQYIPIIDQQHDAMNALIRVPFWASVYLAEGEAGDSETQCSFAYDVYGWGLAPGWEFTELDEDGNEVTSPGEPLLAGVEPVWGRMPVGRYLSAVDGSAALVGISPGSKSTSGLNLLYVLGEVPDPSVCNQYEAFCDSSGASGQSNDRPPIVSRPFQPPPLTEQALLPTNLQRIVRRISNVVRRTNKEK